MMGFQDIVAQAMVAGRRAVLTKIMNGLVRGLASNGPQVSNKDR